jgi:hypothetical protein
MSSIEISSVDMTGMEESNLVSSGFCSSKDISPQDSWWTGGIKEEIKERWCVR